MNYDDELERARSRRSRRRGNASAETTRQTRSAIRTGEENLNLNVEAGSRAARNRADSASYRRKKKKKSTTIWTILLGILLAVVIIAIAFGAGLFGYVNGELEEVQTKLPFDKEEVVNEEIPVEVREKMEKGFWTVAVFGVDSRDNSLGKGNQSDVIMIANLNRSTGEIKLVSVYRDTYLNISDKNTYNKINAAYAYGGPEAAVKALNKNLDLNITHYATFNWKAVATVINILGGVEIEISPAEFHYINAFITETVKGTGIGSTQLKKAGVHNLDGVQAVAYGRLRLMDSDYARTERQRIVIQKAFEKVKTAKLSTLNDVVGHVFEMSATNIGFEDLAGLIKDVSKYHLGETTGFPAARGEKRIKIGKDSLSCVIPQTLESNVISIHKFLFGEETYTPSNTVMEISKKIANVSGLATEGEEIGHVAVDKGWIPKKTTAAAADNDAADNNANNNANDNEDISEGQSREDDMPEGATAESDESESEMESGSAAETDESFQGLYPGIVTGPNDIFGSDGTASSSDAPSGPRFPGDTSAETSEAYGPGSHLQKETTGAASGPGSRPGSSPSGSEIRPGGVSPSESAEEGDSPMRPGSTTITTKPGSGTTAPGGAGTTTETTESGSASENEETPTIPSSPADAIIQPGTSAGPAGAPVQGEAPGA